jgi:hypothetical protein
VHKHVIAPDKDAFHPHESAFKQSARQDDGMFVTEALSDEQAVSVTAFVEHIELVGQAAHGSSFLKVACPALGEPPITPIIHTPAPDVEKNIYARH